MGKGFRSDGKVKGGDRQKLDLTLKPETHQRVLAGGFRMIARIELEPGRYQLRVAARPAVQAALEAEGLKK